MSLEYRVVPKSAIPSTPPTTNELYGQWAALARLLPRLASSEAVEIELGRLSPAVAVSSLHGAARVVGVKISTMRVGGRMYVFRTGVTGKARRPMVWEYVCKCCKGVKKGKRPKQEYCPEKECQAERRRVNNRNFYNRRRRKK